MNQKVNINGTDFKACLCGCNGPIISRSTYKPGHDARHASITAQEAVEAFEHGQGHWDSKEFYLQLPSEALRAKALKIAENLVTKQAPALSGQGVVKVGRWTYPARITRAGRVERNTNRDGSGSWVKADPSKYQAGETS